jgi:holo-[acyl-carrier protein] synthase
MIFGIGTDIVEISRFERFLREGNTSLIERLFTQGERDYCAVRRRSAQHYALRFAAKEAFLKALGTGLRDGLSWQQVEVFNDHLGKPGLNLSGRAAELYSAEGLGRIFVSLSHDGNCAVAMVVLERTG